MKCNDGHPGHGSGQCAKEARADPITERERRSKAAFSLESAAYLDFVRSIPCNVMIVPSKLQGMYVKRGVTDKLKKLVKAFPVVVVSGARQVGKTTLLRHVFPDLDYVAFESQHRRRERARRV